MSSPVHGTRLVLTVPMRSTVALHRRFLRLPDTSGIDIRDPNISTLVKISPATYPRTGTSGGLVSQHKGGQVKETS